MIDHQLPVYLQNRDVPDFTDFAGDGLGSTLPPHVSIQGNVFTLIDAAGQEYQPMPTMDVVIVDRSNVTCKMYFGKPWTPGQESRDPPMCWSTNGIGPSREAQVPQARTCAECANNVKGSAISAISGATIKACRDEFHLAILLPTIPDMMFRYVLTPGSFKNWNAYIAPFKNSNVKISMVVTRMSFVPKVNGEVMFSSVGWAEPATNDVVVAALRAKKTDALVGRNDVPRTAALTASVQQAATPTQMPPQGQQFLESHPGVTGPVPFTPSAQVPTTPLAAFPTPSGGPAAAFQQPAAAIPSEPAPAGRRKRRTSAEMQEANGAAAPGPGSQGVAQAPQAPFPHPGQQTQPQGTQAFIANAPSQQAPQGNFGMAPGTPAGADPAVSAQLDAFFKGA